MPVLKHSLTKRRVGQKRSPMKNNQVGGDIAKYVLTDGFDGTKTELIDLLKTKEVENNKTGNKIPFKDITIKNIAYDGEKLTDETKKKIPKDASIFITYDSPSEKKEVTLPPKVDGVISFSETYEFGIVYESSDNLRSLLEQYPNIVGSNQPINGKNYVLQKDMDDSDIKNLKMDLIDFIKKRNTLDSFFVMNGNLKNEIEAMTKTKIINKSISNLIHKKINGNTCNAYNDLILSLNKNKKSVVSFIQKLFIKLLENESTIAKFYLNELKNLLVTPFLTTDNREFGYNLMSQRVNRQSLYIESNKLSNTVLNSEIPVSDSVFANIININRTDKTVNLLCGTLEYTDLNVDDLISDLSKYIGSILNSSCFNNNLLLISGYSTLKEPTKKILVEKLANYKKTNEEEFLLKDIPLNNNLSDINNLFYENSSGNVIKENIKNIMDIENVVGNRNLSMVSVELAGGSTSTSTEVADYDSIDPEVNGGRQYYINKIQKKYSDLSKVIYHDDIVKHIHIAVNSLKNVQDALTNFEIINNRFDILFSMCLKHSGTSLSNFKLVEHYSEGFFDTTNFVNRQLPEVMLEKLASPDNQPVDSYGYLPWYGNIYPELNLLNTTDLTKMQDNFDKSKFFKFDNLGDKIRNNIFKNFNFIFFRDKETVNTEDGKENEFSNLLNGFFSYDDHLQDCFDANVSIYTKEDLAIEGTDVKQESKKILYRRLLKEKIMCLYRDQDESLKLFSMIDKLNSYYQQIYNNSKVYLEVNELSWDTEMKELFLTPMDYDFYNLIKTETDFVDLFTCNGEEPTGENKILSDLSNYNKLIKSKNLDQLVKNFEAKFIRLRELCDETSTGNTLYADILEKLGKYRTLKKKGEKYIFEYDQDDIRINNVMGDTIATGRFSTEKKNFKEFRKRFLDDNITGNMFNFYTDVENSSRDQTDLQIAVSKKLAVFGDDLTHKINVYPLKTRIEIGIILFELFDSKCTNFLYEITKLDVNGILKYFNGYLNFSCKTDSFLNSENINKFLDFYVSSNNDGKFYHNETDEYFPVLCTPFVFKKSQTLKIDWEKINMSGDVSITASESNKDYNFFDQQNNLVTEIKGLSLGEEKENEKNKLINKLSQQFVVNPQLDITKPEIIPSEFNRISKKTKSQIMFIVKYLETIVKFHMNSDKSLKPLSHHIKNRRLVLTKIQNLIGVPTEADDVDKFKNSFFDDKPKKNIVDVLLNTQEVKADINISETKKLCMEWLIWSIKALSNSKSNIQARGLTASFINFIEEIINDWSKFKKKNKNKIGYLLLYVVSVLLNFLIFYGTFLEKKKNYGLKPGQYSFELSAKTVQQLTTIQEDPLKIRIDIGDSELKCPDDAINTLKETLQEDSTFLSTLTEDNQKDAYRKLGIMCLAYKDGSEENKNLAKSLKDKYFQNKAFTLNDFSEALQILSNTKVNSKYVHEYFGAKSTEFKIFGTGNLDDVNKWVTKNFANDALVETAKKLKLLTTEEISNLGTDSEVNALKVKCLLLVRQHETLSNISESDIKSDTKINGMTVSEFKEFVKKNNDVTKLKNAFEKANPDMKGDKKRKLLYISAEYELNWSKKSDIIYGSDGHVKDLMNDDQKASQELSKLDIPTIEGVNPRYTVALIRLTGNKITSISSKGKGVYEQLSDTGSIGTIDVTISPESFEKLFDERGNVPDIESKFSRNLNLDLYNQGFNNLDIEKAQFCEEVLKVIAKKKVELSDKRIEQVLDFFKVTFKSIAKSTAWTLLFDNLNQQFLESFIEGIEHNVFILFFKLFKTVFVDLGRKHVLPLIGLADHKFAENIYDNLHYIRLISGAVKILKRYLEASDKTELKDIVIDEISSIAVSMATTSLVTYIGSSVSAGVSGVSASVSAGIQSLASTDLASGIASYANDSLIWLGKKYSGEENDEANHQTGINIAAATTVILSVGFLAHRFMGQNKINETYKNRKNALEAFKNTTSKNYQQQIIKYIMSTLHHMLGSDKIIGIYRYYNYDSFGFDTNKPQIIDQLISKISKKEMLSTKIYFIDESSAITVGDDDININSNIKNLTEEDLVNITNQIKSLIKLLIYYLVRGIHYIHYNQIVREDGPDKTEDKIPEDIGNILSNLYNKEYLEQNKDTFDKFIGINTSELLINDFIQNPTEKGIKPLPFLNDKLDIDFIDSNYEFIEQLRKELSIDFNEMRDLKEKINLFLLRYIYKKLEFYNYESFLGKRNVEDLEESGEPTDVSITINDYVLNYTVYKRMYNGVIDDLNKNKEAQIKEWNSIINQTAWSLFLKIGTIILKQYATSIVFNLLKDTYLDGINKKVEQSTWWGGTRGVGSIGTSLALTGIGYIISAGAVTATPLGIALAGSAFVFGAESINSYGSMIPYSTSETTQGELTKQALNIFDGNLSLKSVTASIVWLYEYGFKAALDSMGIKNIQVSTLQNFSSLSLGLISSYYFSKTQLSDANEQIRITPDKYFENPEKYTNLANKKDYKENKDYLISVGKVLKDIAIEKVQLYTQQKDRIFSIRQQFLNDMSHQVFGVGISGIEQSPHIKTMNEYKKYKDCNAINELFKAILQDGDGDVFEKTFDDKKYNFNKSDSTITITITENSEVTEHKMNDIIKEIYGSPCTDPNPAPDLTNSDILLTKLVDPNYNDFETNLEFYRHNKENSSHFNNNLMPSFFKFFENRKINTNLKKFGLLMDTVGVPDKLNTIFTSKHQLEQTMINKISTFVEAQAPETRGGSRLSMSRRTIKQNTSNGGFVSRKYNRRLANNNRKQVRSSRSQRRNKTKTKKYRRRLANNRKTKRR